MQAIDRGLAVERHTVRTTWDLRSVAAHTQKAKKRSRQQHDARELPAREPRLAAVAERPRTSEVLGREARNANARLRVCLSKGTKERGDHVRRCLLRVHVEDDLGEPGERFGERR